MAFSIGEIGGIVGLIGSEDTEIQTTPLYTKTQKAPPVKG
jgi:hypothetical protein